MLRSSVVCVICLAAFTATAHAAPQSSTKIAPPYMDLQLIGFPAIVRGRLMNYIFAEVRLTLGRGVDAARMQDQEPFLRDTLVRAATHTPFNPPQDSVHLDEPRLKAEVLRIAASQLGPGKVVSVEIRSQAPQRRTGVPGGAQP